MSSGAKRGHHWRIPECLERPQYRSVLAGGVNYRVLDIPDSASCLNSARWSHEAFESLASGALRLRQSASAKPSRLRAESAGGESYASEASSYSSDTSDSSAIDSDRLAAADIARELQMTEQQAAAEEEALDAQFLASCAATEVDGEWCGELRLPRTLHRRFVGKNSTRGPLLQLLDSLGVRLEAEQCSNKAKGGTVSLQLWGPTERRVGLALKKVQELVAASRARAPVTHFVSLPLSCPSVVERYEVYRHLVMASGYKTIDETLFIDKEKLHVTLLVLRLYTEDEVKKAAEALKAVAPDIYDAVDTRCLLLHLKGNSCFSDDPSAVAVVFAPLYSSEGIEALAATKRTLNSIVKLVADKLQAVGLLSRQELEEQHALGPQGEIDVCYHMTLLNETYRRRAMQQQQQEQGQRRPPWKGRPQAGIDATQLIQDMRGFDFGKVRIPAVQLNAISGGTQGGGYNCLAHVDLP